MTIQLTLDNVQTLVSPIGASDSLVKGLFDSQYVATLLALGQVSKTLAVEASALVEQTGFARAMNTLQALPAATQRHILGYPSAAFWSNVALDLIARQSHRRFPEQHMRVHLHEFWRFAIAGMLITPGQSQLMCEVWTNEYGALVIPGIGRFIQLCERKALQRVVVEINDGWLKVCNAETHESLSYKWHEVARMACGIELNDADTDLRLANRLPYQFEYLDAERTQLWMRVLDEAWSVIMEVNPILASEIVIGTHVIVPVISEAAQMHISATFREAPGLMALSWTPDPLVMAEAIVHEYHHQKLNCLLNLDRLIMGPSFEPKYYSPWRRDPRPLTGILHGAFVFQAVHEFYTNLVTSGHDERYKPVALKNACKRYVQVRAALKSLVATADWSPIGSALLAGMAVNLTQQQARLPAIEEEEMRRLETDRDAHQQQWLKENPSKPQPLSASLQTNLSKVDEPDSAHTATLRTAEQDALRWLGLPTSFDIYTLLGQHSPTDPVLQAAISARWDSSRSFTELNGIIQATKRGDSLLLNLIAGHIAFILDEYQAAATNYGWCVIRQPETPYFWQCLAFALRHLGRHLASERILSNLPVLAVEPLTKDSICRCIGNDAVVDVAAYLWPSPFDSNREESTLELRP